MSHISCWRRCPPLMSTARQPYWRNTSGAIHIGLVVDGYAREEGGLVGIWRTSSLLWKEHLFHGGYHIIFADNRWPLVDTKTGSRIINRGNICPECQRRSLLMWCDEKSIPIFIASHEMSESTASSCAFTMWGEIACISVTPQVFCAVTAVMTDIPDTVSADMVLRSVVGYRHLRSCLSLQ